MWKLAFFPGKSTAVFESCRSGEHLRSSSTFQKTKAPTLDTTLGRPE